MPGPSAPYDSAAFQREFNISDDSRRRLEIYAALLLKWQLRINLVSSATLPHLWRRHMRDSAQLHEYMPENRAPWFDIGSGAGFPGLVLTLLAEPEQAARVHLVESDQRKAVFLSEVIRATGASAAVHSRRAEQLTPEMAGGLARLITARAVAPLHQLLELTASIIGPETVFLLLKGQHIDDELTLAAKYRKMIVSRHPSRTDPAGVVLRITEVARV